MVTDFRVPEDLPCDRVTLVDWLQETYFDDEKKPYFAKADLELVGELLKSMMQYRPADRPRVSQLLHHGWFQRNPFQVDKVASGPQSLGNATPTPYLYGLEPNSSVMT